LTTRIIQILSKAETIDETACSRSVQKHAMTSKANSHEIIQLNPFIMKRFIFLFVPVLLAWPSQAEWQYPPTKTVDASDTYFGKTYKDPYRWLEDMKDKEVEAWFKAQAGLTDGLLAKIPGRDELAQEWMALDKLKPATYDTITYENGRVFYKKTLGGENVGKLFFRDCEEDPFQTIGL